MAIEMSLLGYRVPKTWMMLSFLMRSFSFSILNRVRGFWSGTGLVAAMIEVAGWSEE